MIALSLGVVGAVIALVVCLVLGLPLLALVLGLAPWLLGLVGVVLLVKALLEKPTVPANFTPAVVALLASAILRWIF